MRLSTPDKCDLTVLREWLDRPEGGDMFFESAAEMDVYNERNDSDMIALFSRHEGVDNLTRLIFNRVVPWFHKRWGEKYQVSIFRVLYFFIGELITFKSAQ